MSDKKKSLDDPLFGPAMHPEWELLLADISFLPLDDVEEKDKYYPFKESDITGKRKKK